MINSYLSVEQTNREKQGIEAREVEANSQTDWYWAGEFDGAIAIDPNPETWSNLSYREGFLTGLARHYDQKYQTCLSDQPF